MLSPDQTLLLSQLSRNVQAVGRKLVSPKNDFHDLKMLAEALEHDTNAVRSIVNSIDLHRRTRT